MTRFHVLTIALAVVVISTVNYLMTDGTASDWRSVCISIAVVTVVILLRCSSGTGQKCRSVMRAGI